MSMSAQGVVRVKDCEHWGLQSIVMPPRDDPNCSRVVCSLSAFEDSGIGSCRKRTPK